VGQFGGSSWSRLSVCNAGILAGVRTDPLPIPAPAGTFSLLLRNYWPEEAILNGASVPPDVEKVK